MVGAAVGFGGRLMRTVSFFGCTLPVSFFGGGTTPDGTGGGGGVDEDDSDSAIGLNEDKQHAAAVKFNSKTKITGGRSPSEIPADQVFSSINSRRAPPSSWPTKLVE
jgi:hypothetical protein